MKVERRDASRVIKKGDGKGQRKISTAELRKERSGKGQQGKRNDRKQDGGKKSGKVNKQQRHGGKRGRGGRFGRKGGRSKDAQ